MGHLHGQLREWRRILPLQLLGHKRVRQDRARGYLRSRMPAYCGSSYVWCFPVTEEDEAHKDYQDVVQEVIAHPLVSFLCSCDGLCVGVGIKSLQLYKMNTIRPNRLRVPYT